MSEITEKLLEFAKRLRLLNAEFETFADAAFPDNNDPVWDVWQSLSTAEAKMTKFVDAL